MFVKFVKQL